MSSRPGLIGVGLWTGRLMEHCVTPASRTDPVVVRDWRSHNQFAQLDATIARGLTRRWPARKRLDVSTASAVALLKSDGWLLIALLPEVDPHHTSSLRLPGDIGEPGIQAHPPDR
jgi:hypothetical protein